MVAGKIAKKSIKSSNSIIWDLGRAYFAYVGLLERVLVDQKLDHILRPGMGVVLFALYEKDQVPIKELAERSQLACSTLTGVLQRMENAGLVVRCRDEKDGRLVVVSLTALGKKLKRKSFSIAQHMTEISEKGVGAENADTCSQYLRGLTTSYRQEEMRLSAEAQKSTS